MSSPSLATKPSKNDCRGNKPCSETNINVGGGDGGHSYAQGGDGGHAVNSNVIKIHTGAQEVYGGEGGEAYSSSSSDASAESDSVSTANADTNVTINETRPRHTTVRNVASPDTPNPYPTSPCRIGVSAGVSVAGFAGSGGGSVEDTECTLRETARSFKDLGVPEVGLILLCQNSVVVNGRYDKKGNLEENEPAPIGAEECLRLVREFQRDDSAPDSGDAERTASQELREQQDRIEQQLLARLDAMEQKLAEQDKDHQSVVRKVGARPVVKEVVQQPYLTDDKKAKLAALLSDEEETK